MRLKYYQILILGIIANVTATSFFASNEQLGTGQIELILMPPPGSD